MRTRALFLVPLVLGALSCTEVELPAAALAAKLPTSIVADEATELLAQMKPPGPLCPSKPDLAIDRLTVSPASITVFDGFGHTVSFPVPGQVNMCVKIRNVGGVAWGSAANQWNVAVGTLDGTIAGSLTGVVALAPGAVVERCKVVTVPLLLRVGHDTPTAGVCPVSTTLNSRIVFDPDIASDALASNDDCLSKNNTKSAQLDYMASCPW